jgi:hypothetical protein
VPSCSNFHNTTLQSAISANTLCKPPKRNAFLICRNDFSWIEISYWLCSNLRVSHLGKNFFHAFGRKILDFLNLIALKHALCDFRYQHHKPSAWWTGWSIKRLYMYATVDGKNILNQYFEKQGMRIWNGFRELKTGSNGMLSWIIINNSNYNCTICKHGQWSSDSHLCVRTISLSQCPLQIQTIILTAMNAHACKTVTMRGVIVTYQRAEAKTVAPAPICAYIKHGINKEYQLRCFSWAHSLVSHLVSLFTHKPKVRKYDLYRFSAAVDQRKCFCCTVFSLKILLTP